MHKGDFRRLFGIRLGRCPGVIPEKNQLSAIIFFYSRLLCFFSLMLLHFLSLVPDVISLTSIRLTTEPISKSYLGPAITGHCGPLEATHPQMGHSSETPQMSHPFSGWISVSGLTYPLSLCRTNPWLAQVAEKSPA